MSTTYTDIDDVLPARIWASINPVIDHVSYCIKTINSIKRETDLISIKEALSSLAEMGLCLIPYTKNNYDPVTMNYSYILAYPLGKKLFARLRFVALAVPLNAKSVAGYYKSAYKNFVDKDIVTLNYNPACITRAELKDNILNMLADFNIEAFDNNVDNLMSTIPNCVRLTPTNMIRIRDDTVVFRIDFLFDDKNLEDTYNYITNTLKCIPEFKIIL